MCVMRHSHGSFGRMIFIFIKNGTG